MTKNLLCFEECHETNDASSCHTGSTESQSSSPMPWTFTMQEDRGQITHTHANVSSTPVPLALNRTPQPQSYDAATLNCVTADIMRRLSVVPLYLQDRVLRVCLDWVSNALPHPPAAQLFLDQPNSQLLPGLCSFTYGEDYGSYPSQRMPSGDNHSFVPLSHNAGTCTPPQAVEWPTQQDFSHEMSPALSHVSMSPTAVVTEPGECWIAGKSLAPSAPSSGPIRQRHQWRRKASSRRKERLVCGLDGCLRELTRDSLRRHRNECHYGQKRKTPRKGRGSNPLHDYHAA